MPEAFGLQPPPTPPKEGGTENEACGKHEGCCICSFEERESHRILLLLIMSSYTGIPLEDVDRSPLLWRGRGEAWFYSGGYSGGVPPLPIPNREVKPARADGTAHPWESR